MNSIKSQPTFTSTIIPKQAMKNFGKFTEELNKSFELKGMGGSVESIRSKIDFGQAGVGFVKDEVAFIGKDKSADNFIFRRLSNIDKNVKYIDDAPELKPDSDAIEFSILG